MSGSVFRSWNIGCFFPVPSVCVCWGGAQSLFKPSQATWSCQIQYPTFWRALLVSQSTHGAKGMLVICFCQQPLPGFPRPRKPAAYLPPLHDFWEAGGKVICIFLHILQWEGELRISDDRKWFEIGTPPLFLSQKRPFPRLEKFQSTAGRRFSPQLAV